MSNNLKDILKLSADKLEIEFDENKFDDFNYVRKIFEEVKKRRDELSRNEVNELNSSYLTYVSDLNKKTLKEYNSNLGIYENNFRVDEFYKKDDSLNRALKNEELENTDELRNKGYVDSEINKKFKIHKDKKVKKTKKAGRIAVTFIVVAGIIVGVGSAYTKSINVKDDLATTSVSASVELDDFEDAISFDYVLVSGDNCKNDVAKKLDIKEDELKVKDNDKAYNNSFAEKQAGDTVSLEAKNTNYNKEKVDDYNYVNKKDVSMSFSFTIANGDSLINLATELMNDNPVLKEIYSTPNALASDMAKQNKMTPSLIYPGDYNLTVNTTKKIADEYNIKTSTLSK